MGPTGKPLQWICYKGNERNGLLIVISIIIHYASENNLKYAITRKY